MLKSPNYYTEEDKMKDLINDNSLLLMVMSRFGISLGFAEKNVEEVCKEHNVDTSTFLAVANFIAKGITNNYKISLEPIMSYLRKAHNHFLDFQLPTIRRKLIEALDCSSDASDIPLLIIKFYDDYAAEVYKHMSYENNVVFAYVTDLLNKKLSDEYSMKFFMAKHNHIDTKLVELKDIIIKYYPQKQNDLLNSVLFDIISCEQDLISHCQVEELLFAPEVQKLEIKVKNSPNSVYVTKEAHNEDSDADKLGNLSEREKEIIACIAKGMTYKEIAEALCLSVHTVNTHRRNISSKLEIHSAAGLTIFAIINKLVKLEEIKQLIYTQEGN